MVAYLCSGKRVALPFAPGSAARCPADLSDLLLQDVEAKVQARTTRIDDAISSVQALVQRARLGLESSVHLPFGFGKLWDTKYATFKLWETGKRRDLYPENWIHWDELRLAKGSDSLRRLERQLKRGVLTVPKPSSSLSWSGQEVPESQLDDLQSVELVSLTASGSSLIGQPRHSGQLSLLAQLPADNTDAIRKLDGAGQPSGANDKASAVQKGQLPLWEEAAVKLGTTFVQVAAASTPIATGSFEPSAGLNGAANTIDEFFFWLTPGRSFNDEDAKQNLTLGQTPPDPACDWDPTRGKLGNLLQWNARNVFYLNWCRVRSGQVGVARQSDQAIEHGGLDTPLLGFVGRKADFLLFSINGMSSFQYDMARDYVDVLAADASTAGQTGSVANIDTSHVPKNLAAYPFFIHFDPGAPPIPLSNFSIALSVASTLTSKGCFDEALKWIELAFNAQASPLNLNNSWDQQSQATPAVVKDRAALLEYLEVLLNWAESSCSQSDSASRRRALVCLSLAAKILGATPDTVVLDDTAPESMTIGNFKPSATPLSDRLMKAYSSVAHNLAVLSEGQGPTSALAPYGGNTVVSSLHSPHSRHLYRFSYLLPRARELAEAACSLGGQLLSALEKGDSEYLASLQTGYERQVASVGLESRKDQFRAADWDVQNLEISLQKTLNELSYTQTLIRNGNNAKETGFEVSTGVSLGSHTAATAILAAAEGVSSVPDVYVGGAGVMGSPLEFNKITGGSSLGSALNFAASILNTGAESANTIANMLLVQSGWDRRRDEWLHQADTLTVDLEVLESQKLAADRRREIALADLNAGQRQIERATEVQDFVRDKTSSFDLYLYLQREAAVLYRQSYDMALQAAREAQEMMRYELRPTGITGPPPDLLADCAWDGIHQGLAAGERLSLALRAMDRAYTTANVREYELTKQFSLNMHFPAAFLQLKATGRCDFSPAEWMFDMDYPGHYLRRIKDVSLSIPCVIGPYTGVHCRLELQRSTIRLRPDLLDGQRYECTTPATDARFVHLYGARQAIATSHGAADSGLFEVGFHDDRYLPFEYAGAVATWSLELPPENNAMDMASLTDVMVTLQYTAREGGETLRRAARLAARKRLPGGGERLFDVRTEFPDAGRRCSGGYGMLKFPDGMGLIREMYLLCRYEVQDTIVPGAVLAGTRRA